MSATDPSSLGPSTGASVPYAWSVVIVLALVYIYAFIDRSVFGILLEPIRTDLGLSDTEVSLVGSLGFAVCYTLFQLPAGRAADLYNRRNLILGGIVLWSAMTAACGLADSFTTLLIGRMGIGLGEAALVPAAYSLICDYFDPRRSPRPLAAFQTAAPLGAALALALGGALLAAFTAAPALVLPGGRALAPWQAVFLSLGLAGFLFAALMLLVREPPRQVRSAADRETSLRAVFAYLGTIRSFFLPFMAGTALMNLVTYGYGAWLPALFVRHFHWAPDVVGYWMGVILLLAGTPAPLLAASLARRLVRRGDPAAVLKVIAAGCALLLAGAVALPLMPTGWSALAVMVPLQFAAFIIGGVVPTALMQVAPARMRAQISSFWLFVGNMVGIGFGATAFALVTDYVFGDPAALPWSMALVAAASLSSALAAFCLAIRPFRRLATQGGTPAAPERA